MIGEPDMILSTILFFILFCLALIIIGLLGRDKGDKRK